MPNDIGKLLIGLEKELILLRDKVTLVGDELGVVSKGVMDESKLIAEVGWV